MKKKKGGGGGGGGHDAAGGLRWLLTYADLITLLLVFFIVVALLSAQDTKKIKEFQQAVAEAFAPLFSDRPFAIPGAGSGEGMRGHGEGYRSRGPVVLMRQLEKAAREIGLENVVIAHEENPVIDFAASDFFAPGAVTALTPTARNFLDTFVLLLAVSDQSVEVSAHVPPGTLDAWGITSARSVAVARYLTETRGVEPDRVVAAASGTHPHRIGAGQRPVAAEGVTFYLFGGPRATAPPPAEAFP